MTKNGFFILGALGLIILVIAGVFITSFQATTIPGLSQTRSETGTVSPAYLVYTQYDNGAVSPVHRGDIIAVRLPENPATWYTWNITHSQGLEILSDTYIPSDPSGQVTGTGATRILTMRTQTTGPEYLTAISRRSWERETGAEQIYSLEFLVS